MNTTKTSIFAIFLLVLVLFLGGCGGQPATPTVEPTAQPLPTAVPAPTETASPNAAPFTTIDLGRIQFQPGATSWYTNGEVPPKTFLRFTLSAMQGQQMTVTLSNEPAPANVQHSGLQITGADGQILTPSPLLAWTGILPATQDYYIDIVPLTTETIPYSISIEIPAGTAIPTTSVAGLWDDPSTFFVLELYQDGLSVYGKHSVVGQNGAKIDAPDASIEGTLSGTVATVTFRSSFTISTGTAEITYVDANTIKWKIIAPPDGEFYLPMEATLTRK